MIKFRSGVNFINVKFLCFPYEHHFSSFFLRMYVHVRTCVKKKAAKTTFARKTRALYVDEIDTYCSDKLSLEHKSFTVLGHFDVRSYSRTLFVYFEINIFNFSRDLILSSVFLESILYENIHKDFFLV